MIKTRNQRMLTLSKQDSKRLLCLSEVVMTSDDPQQALVELENNLDATYSRALSALKQILNSEKTTSATDAMHFKRLGLWQVLIQLSFYSNASRTKILQNYFILQQAQDHLRPLGKRSFTTASYFVLLSAVLVFVMMLFRIKVLPVFDEFFMSMGSELPAYSKQIMYGGFGGYIILVLALVLIFTVLLPLLFQHFIEQLQKLPVYMVRLPPYCFCERLYHRYLWLTYAHVLYNAGDTNPLENVAKSLQLGHIKHVTKNDMALLNTAKWQGNLAYLLQKQAQETARQLEARIQLIEALVKFALFFLIAWLITAPVIAMYLPIFQMGSVLQ